MDKTMKVSPAEEKLIEFIRELRFGTLEVKVHEGQPKEIVRPLERVRLS